MAVHPTVKAGASSPPTRGPRAGVLAVTAFALAAPLPAAEYSLEYGAELFFEHNDNINLRPDQGIEVTGGYLAVPLTFGARTERLESELTGEASFHRYDESAYDSENQDVQGNISYQLERGEVSASAGFLRDTTRDSEFLDSGIIGAAATRRETASAGADTTYLFTERNGLIAGASYADVSYGGDRFQDYDYLSAFAGWLHRWSPRTQLRLQAYGNRTENRGTVSVIYEGLGAQAGIETALSEQLELSLLAGWLSIDTGFDATPPLLAPPGDSEGRYLLSGSLRYRGERAELEARVKSEPRPSGIGILLDGQQLNLDYRYRLAERSRLAVGLVAGRQDAFDRRLQGQQRDYASASLRYERRVSEAWSVSGRYVYRWQEAEFQPDAADGNALYVSVRWSPLKQVWSR